MPTKLDASRLSLFYRYCSHDRRYFTVIAVTIVVILSLLQSRLSLFYRYCSHDCRYFTVIAVTIVVILPLLQSRLSLFYLSLRCQHTHLRCRKDVIVANGGVGRLMPLDNICEMLPLHHTLRVLILTVVECKFASNTFGLMSIFFNYRYFVRIMA